MVTPILWMEDPFIHVSKSRHVPLVPWKDDNILQQFRQSAPITRIQMDLPRLCNVSLPTLIGGYCPKQKGQFK